MFVEPAVSDGAKGNGSEHALPFGPVLIANGASRLAGWFPDHGAIDASVVYVPHNAGVPNGALSVPKNSSFSSSNGKGGVSSKVVSTRPVSLSSETFPASLIRTPALGSSATRYNATSDPNGFAS